MGFHRNLEKSAGNTFEIMEHLMNSGLLDMIARHEGLRLKPYQDTVGVWTVGYGHNLNIPIAESDAWHILETDTQAAINDCLHEFPWFADLSEQRQWVIVDMRFNLGLAGLKQFKKFLRHVELGDYDSAADEMLKSKWAQQVKGRATELAAMMRGSEPV